MLVSGFNLTSDELKALEEMLGKTQKPKMGLRTFLVSLGVILTSNVLGSSVQGFGLVLGGVIAAKLLGVL